VTFKNDVARSGQNLTETALTPSTVNSTGFGLLRNLMVDGKVDAQPLYLSHLTISAAVHNVVYVATENNSVYAFDSDTGTVLWQVSLNGSGEVASDNHGCTQVTPTIGVTSTPVIDRKAGANGTIFLVAMSVDAAGTYRQRLHALDVTTGAELLGGPTAISARYGATSFDPGGYTERAALLLSNGTLYTSWSSHCDNGTYGGWIIAFSESTLAPAAALNIAPAASSAPVDTSTPSIGGAANQGPSVWMSGDGPGADATGNIYLLTANGQFDTTLNSAGFPNGGDYGNSFLRLSLTGSTLGVADYFTMSNEVVESQNDQDLGAGGEMLLPDQTDASGTVWHLAVGAGKDGNLYVVNRDSMGKFSSTANNIRQQLTGALGGSIFSSPAYFNGTIYYGPVNGNLLAFSVAAASVAGPLSAHSPTSFAYPGTSPVVSANGTANAIVWAYENSSSGTAVLHAYNATNLATELYNSNQAANGRDAFGTGNKYIAPVVADGKVFAATTNSVAVFGLLQ
jgi:outer membrane protein assembly factor BamB